LLLPVGYTVPLYPGDGKDYRNDVTTFKILPAKSAEDVRPSHREASSPGSEYHVQEDDPTFPTVLQLCYPKGLKMAGFEGKNMISDFAWKEK